MVKVAVADLENALTLLKKTSTDMHVLVREDGPMLCIQFSNADGHFNTLKLYDEEMRIQASVTADRALNQLVFELKGAK